MVAKSKLPTTSATHTTRAEDKNTRLINEAHRNNISDTTQNFGYLSQ